MKDTKFRILLDIHEVRSQATIPVKVGDVSCKIYITLVEGGKPYKIHENSFGVFTGEKGDKKYLFNNCIIENGIIRYDFTPQTVAAAGVLECEIRIYDEDGGVLTTPSFNIVVDERAVNDSELASTTEFTFLDEIIVNEGQRMENERNRIEAFNNMGLSVEDKGDYYILTKTNKDGSKEEFPIGKGEDYVITPEDYKAIADKVVTDTLDAQAAEYFDNLDAQATEHLENIDKNIDGIIDGKVSVVETATGSAITIESSQAPIPYLRLSGKTTKNGDTLTSTGDSGSFEVGVYGGNIFDVSKISGGTYGSVSVSNENIIFTGYEGNTGNHFAFSYWLDVTPNTDYILTLNSTSIGVIYFYTDKLFGNQLFTSFVEDGKFTFNSGNNKRLLLGFYSMGSQRVGTSETISNIMLNIGTEALPYESFKGKQSITFTDTLRGIGDIADEKDFVKGMTTQKIGVVDLGALVWGKDSATFYTYSLSENATNVISDFEISRILCTHYQADTKANVTSNKNDKTVAMWDNGLLRLVDKSYTDATSLKTALSGVMLYYPLATPIETPISETELNAYRHLMTNKGTTTVLSEADMEISYYVNKPNAQAIGSLHEQINKDYLKLQQAIISTGGN